MRVGLACGNLGAFESREDRAIRMLIGIVSFNVIWKIPKTRYAPSPQILCVYGFERLFQPMLLFRR